MLGLKPEEVAAALNCSVETIRRQYRQGKLRGYKIGRGIRIYPEQFREALGDSYAKFLHDLSGGQLAREPDTTRTEPETFDSLDDIL